MKSILYLLLIVSILLNFSGCKKEYHLEEDPFYTGGRPIWKRLKETHWRLEKITYNEQDYSYLIDNDTLNVYYEFKFPTEPHVNNAGYIYFWNSTMVKRRFDNEEFNSFFENCYGTKEHSQFSTIGGYYYQYGSDKHIGPINYYGDCIEIVKLTNRTMTFRTHYNNEVAYHYFKKIK